MIEFVGKNMEFRGSFVRTSSKTGNAYVVVAFESNSGDRFECLAKKPEEFDQCHKGDIGDFVFEFNPRFNNFSALGVD